MDAQDWSANLRGLLGREHEALAEFIVALGELDARQLYVELGYGSLWDYCRRALGLSEKATWCRIAAAREVAKHPELAEQIRDGRLCITTLATLSRVMIDDNCGALVTEAAGKPTRQVEQIVARLDPKPVPKDVTRPVTEPARLSSPQVTTEVLTETLLRKHITVDAEYEQLLAAARAALSHAQAGAAELDVIKAGLRRIVAEHERRKGVTERPRAPRKAETKDIPHAVLREVWRRDDGRCQWRTEDDGFCGSRHRLEFHHRQDRARGGKHTAENLMLLCSAHHRLATELAWGKGR